MQLSKAPCAGVASTHSRRSGLLGNAATQTRGLRSSGVSVHVASVPRPVATEKSASADLKQKVNRPQQIDNVAFRTVPLMEEVYPGSTREYKETVHEPSGTTLQVPIRRVHLTNGDKFDLYDTSGPQGFHPRQGLPKLRAPWLARREAAGHKQVTQMQYARDGVITEEMAFVAAREGMDVEFVRSEVARGRAIIPANRKHTELEPTVIAHAHPSSARLYGRAGVVRALRARG